MSWKGDKRRNKREEWIKRMMRKGRKERAWERGSEKEERNGRKEGRGRSNERIDFQDPGTPGQQYR